MLDFSSPTLISVGILGLVWMLQALGSPPSEALSDAVTAQAKHVSAVPNSARLEPEEGVQLVRLRRRPVRPFGQGSRDQFFYSARLSVGHPRPQTLHMALDTASGQVILPDSQCSSPACLERRRYRPEASAFAVDINADGTLVEEGQRLATDSTSRDAITIGFSSVDLGDGKVSGHFVADNVCLRVDSYNASGSDGPSKLGACAEVGLVVATTMSEAPFRAAPHDGIIGLGMRGLSIRDGFSFLDRLHEAPAIVGVDPLAQPFATHRPQFALYHGRKFGEAAFGGHNPGRLASTLQWVKVMRPEEGYWQVEISSIRMGNQTIKACETGNCRGIIDSCTSNIGLPAKLMAGFQAGLSSAQDELQHSARGCSGPDLHLNLAGGVQLTLRAEDYMHVDKSSVSSGSSGCQPSISPLDLPESFEGAILLGDPLLRRYYTVFDWTQGGEKIGFGLAAAVSEDGEEELAVAAAEVAEDVEDEAAWASMRDHDDGDQAATLFLLQVFVVRVLAVISLVMFSTHVLSVRTFFSYLENKLVHKSVMKEISEFAPLVPLAETPQGEECVICLGSCDDDPNLLSGFINFNQSTSVIEQGGVAPNTNHMCKVVEVLRWRRLKCGHHFHEACIFEWFRKTRQCPVCRRSLRDCS